MKFAISALLLSATTAVSVNPSNENEIQMPQECMDLEEKVDDASLVEFLN